MHQFFILSWLALTVAITTAQTLTTIDENGATVIEVITSDILGVPTTVTLQTLTTSLTTALTDTTTSPATTLGLPTTTTSTTATTPTTTEPDGQQGPVGQPPTTVGTPGGPTPYTYTTIINGVTTQVVDIFTPTNPATLPPSIGASGTIMDYSSWFSIYGQQPSIAAGAVNGGMKPLLLQGWWGVFMSSLAGMVGGIYLVLG